MKRIIALSSILAATASMALAQDQTYDFADFSALEVNAGVEVIVVLGGDFAVSAVVKRGNIDDLDITQTGQVLRISRETNGNGWSLFGFGSNNDQYTVTVSMPDITDVATTSGADVSLEGQTQTLQTISSTSGSVVSVENADVDMIRVDATSGSDIRVSGDCQEIAIESTSGSMVNAGGFECAILDVSASSGAGVSAFGSQSVTADASSGASIKIGGNANIVDKSTSSGAVITQR